MRLYDAHHSTDPLKLNGLILAYTCKATYNVGGIIVHFSLLMHFNKFSPTPFSNETLDVLVKLYQELKLVFIDEVSLPRSRFLFCIDDRLRNIKHVQTKYLGNVYIIFCDDLYQEQPIQDSMIFEQPILNKKRVPYDFLEIKCTMLWISYYNATHK